MKSLLYALLSIPALPLLGIGGGLLAPLILAGLVVYWLGAFVVAVFTPSKP